jgi:hypothetical protein
LIFPLGVSVRTYSLVPFNPNHTGVFTAAPLRRKETSWQYL